MSRVHLCLWTFFHSFTRELRLKSEDNCELAGLSYLRLGRYVRHPGSSFYLESRLKVVLQTLLTEGKKKDEELIGRGSMTSPRVTLIGRLGGFGVLVRVSFGWIDYLVCQGDYSIKIFAPITTTYRTSTSIRVFTPDICSGKFGVRKDFPTVHSCRKRLVFVVSGKFFSFYESINSIERVVKRSTCLLGSLL